LRPPRQSAAASCGGVRDLSPRQARRIERGECRAICEACRWLAPERERVTDADRRWWLDRFGDAEIVEMAEAMYGATFAKFSSVGSFSSR